MGKVLTRCQMVYYLMSIDCNKVKIRDNAQNRMANEWQMNGKILRERPDFIF